MVQFFFFHSLLSNGKLSIVNRISASHYVCVCDPISHPHARRCRIVREKRDRQREGKLQSTPVHMLCRRSLLSNYSMSLCIYICVRVCVSFHFNAERGTLNKPSTGNQLTLRPKEKETQGDTHIKRLAIVSKWDWVGHMHNSITHCLLYIQVKNSHQRQLLDWPSVHQVTDQVIISFTCNLSFLSELSLAFSFFFLSLSFSCKKAKAKLNSILLTMHTSDRCASQLHYRQAVWTLSRPVYTGYAKGA